MTQSLTFGCDVLTTVAASPGGKLVAVGSESGILRIINTQRIRLFREWLHQSSVTSIVMSPHHICSGSVGSTVVIQKMDPIGQFPLIGLFHMKTVLVDLAAPPPLGDVQQHLVATRHKEVIRVDIPRTPPDDFKIGLETLNRACVMLKVSNKIMSIVAEPTLRE